MLEQVLPPIFAKYGAYDIASQAPFQRIPYLQAMEEFGSDKPDLRIDLRVKDATDLLSGCGFGPFEGGALIKAVPVSDCKLTRKAIDKLCADVEVQAGQKPYWFRVDDKGEIVGGIAKFLNADPALAERVKAELSLANDTLVLLCAGTSVPSFRRGVGAGGGVAGKPVCRSLGPDPLARPRQRSHCSRPPIGALGPLAEALLGLLLPDGTRADFSPAAWPAGGHA